MLNNGEFWNAVRGDVDEILTSKEEEERRYQKADVDGLLLH